MKQDVKNNLSQIKSLRQSLEWVKGERRDAIKAMIQWLMDENAGNRETQSKFRSDFGGKREAVKSEIKRSKILLDYITTTIAAKLAAEILILNIWQFQNVQQQVNHWTSEPNRRRWSIRKIEK